MIILISCAGIQQVSAGIYVARLEAGCVFWKQTVGARELGNLWSSLRWNLILAESWKDYYYGFIRDVVEQPHSRFNVPLRCLDVE